MNKEQSGLTVRQAVERFINEFFAKIGESDKRVKFNGMLERVCITRGCQPEDDGTEVWEDLSEHLKNQEETERAASGAGAEGAPRHGHGSDMAWHEVGRGTDPIKYLSHPDANRLCAASVAMREHYERR